MRILQINNYHYPRGGSDRYFLQLTEMLKQEGHTVATFAANHPRTIRMDWLVVPPPDSIDTSRAVGISNVVSYLYSPEARRRMTQAIDIFKPDVAHLHIFYGQLTASILKPLLKAEIPIVQTLHEYKLVCPTHGLYAQGKYCDACQGYHYWHALLKHCNRNSLTRSALSMIEAYVSDFLGVKNHVNQFITVSNFQKQQLVRLGIPDEKLTVLHHFAEVAQEPATEPGSYFLYVGRILEEKGIGILLEAYAMLGKGSPLLKIVGGGSDLDRWHAYARDMGIADKIEWLGFRYGDELDDLYHGCIAVINPSLLNETFGLTCIEALSRGRPVIASRVGAFPEVVTNDVDGLLFDAANINQLSAALNWMDSHRQQAAEMGKEGKKKVQLHFSANKHYAELMSVYRKVIVA